jgi:hypothetical protein
MASNVLVASGGVRVTTRHHFDFGPDRALVGDDLVRADAWDALRTRSDGPFSLACSRAELEQAADSHPDIGERARAIERSLQEFDVGTLASYGVGGGVLEAWLLRLAPKRRLVMTDYAPGTVAGLRELFPEAEIVQHDLLNDAPLDANMHMFHRIDTELTDEAWHQVFERFAHEDVLVVATEVATMRRVAQELMLRARNRHLTRAGWLRTRSSFELLWRETHAANPLRLYDLDGWALTPRAP